MTKQNEAQLINPVKLTEVTDGLQADFLVTALKENGVPAYKTSMHSGGVMNAYMGFSIYGAGIFVDEEDLALAKELLAEIESGNEEDWKFDEEDEAYQDFESENEDEDDSSNSSFDQIKTEGANILRHVILIGLALFGGAMLLRFFYIIYLLIKIG